MLAYSGQLPFLTAPPGPLGMGDVDGTYGCESTDGQAAMVPNSCDATRHGPPVAYDDEQHRQGPGVLWRMGNLGPDAASG